jgi:hypothetical protein
MVETLHLGHRTRMASTILAGENEEINFLQMSFQFIRILNLLIHLHLHRFHSVEETFMAKMTDRLNRRLAGEVLSDDDEDEATQANTSVGDSNRSKSDEGTISEESSLIEPQISNLSMTSRQDSRETPVKSSSSRGNPLSPRAATNMQMMQMHLQKSVAAGRVQSDDWSVSSIGQNSASSPGLPPQTRKRKPFSGR